MCEEPAVDDGVDIFSIIEGEDFNDGAHVNHQWLDECDTPVHWSRQLCFYLLSVGNHIV